MTQSNFNQIGNEKKTFLKWGLGILLILFGIYSLFKSSVIGGFLLFLVGVSILPPISAKNKAQYPFWNNNILRRTVLGILTFTGLILVNKNNPNPVGSLNFNDKKDILIQYIKSDSLDQSIQNLKKLGEIGELFGNGNYCTIHPHDGYIFEVIDSMTKKQILHFNPRYDFEDAKEYLKNDPKNGLIQDYVIDFELNDSGKIVSEKTKITFSKSGIVEYQKDLVPLYSSFVNLDIVESQKVKREAQNLVAQQNALRDAIKKGFEEKCLSSWDGSHRELVEIVKKNMNDPESFDHDETRYTLYKDYAIVIMTFRGKNKFGGLVLNSVKAKVNIEDCSIISVEQ